jgi:hypothetical protein
MNDVVCEVRPIGQQPKEESVTIMNRPISAKSSPISARLIAILMHVQAKEIVVRTRTRASRHPSTRPPTSGRPSGTGQAAYRPPHSHPRRDRSRHLRMPSTPPPFCKKWTVPITVDIVDWAACLVALYLFEIMQFFIGLRRVRVTIRFATVLALSLACVVFSGLATSKGLRLTFKFCMV